MKKLVTVIDKGVIVEQFETSSKMPALKSLCAKIGKRMLCGSILIVEIVNSDTITNRRDFYDGVPCGKYKNYWIREKFKVAIASKAQTVQYLLSAQMFRWSKNKQYFKGRYDEL